MSALRTLALALAVVLAPATDAREPSQLEKNKAAVVRFYNAFLNDKDVEDAIAMMGPTYTQHSARIPDGKDGFRAFFTTFKARHPHAEGKIVRVFAEGEYVILHAHITLEPGTRGDAVMDIFRLESGKPVEHWDVVQPIPDKIPHSNGMF